MKLSGSICVAFILCVLIFPAQSECGFIGLVSDLYDQAASTTSSIASVLCDGRHSESKKKYVKNRVQIYRR